MPARVLAVILVVSSLIVVSPSRVATGSPAPPYLVVIVIDGFRPDYMTLAPMKHLRALMKRGRVYDSAWVGQIEAETPTGHATIATGVYPRKHGVIGFGWRDPTSGGFTFMPTNVGQIRSGALAHVVESAGVPTISDLIHARTRSDITVSVSAEKLWASAPLGVGADYLLYGWEVPVRRGQNKFHPIPVGANTPPAKSGYQTVTEPDSTFDYQDDFASRVAVKLVAYLRPRALLLNLPATDIAGHYYGGIGDRQDMTSIVRGADNAIGKVVNEYRKLGLLNKTVFVVTADHGMVTGRHRVPNKAVYKAVAATGVSAQEQSLLNSQGSIWLHDPEHAQMLASKLVADHFPGIEGALYKVPDGAGWKFAPEAHTSRQLAPALLRAYLDLADTEASPNGAEVLLPYAEDTVGLPGSHRFQGMHGGFSWGSQHIPLVIAGPGVQPGVSHFPAQLVDIAPTVERLIGLSVPGGVDGVVLSDALRNGTAAERAAQQAVRARRAADQKAVRNHSAAQLRGGS